MTQKRDKPIKIQNTGELIKRKRDKPIKIQNKGELIPRKKRDKPIKISTQTTIDLSLSNLFCFPKVQPSHNSKLYNQIRLIHQYTPSINLLAENKMRLFIIPYEIDLFVQAIKYAINMRHHVHITEWLSVIFKLGLALHLIATRTTNGHYHLIESPSLIDVLSTFSDELTDQPEEIWWYYAAALNLQIGWSHEEVKSKHIVDQLTACLDKIQNKKCLLGVVYFILHIIEQGYFYPDLSPFQKISSVCPEKLQDHECESVCALKRDIHIHENYTNKDYLWFSQTTGLNKIYDKQKIILTYENPRQAQLGSQKNISITVTPYELIQFAAHLIPPTKPILKLVIPGLTETENENLNIDIKNKLRAKGFSNSEGILTKKFYKKSNAYTVKTIIMHCIDNYIQKSGKPYPDGRDAYEATFNTFNSECIKKRDLLKKVNDEVSGFKRLDALVLAYRCLIPCKYGLEQTLLNQVIKSVALCINILAEAERINHHRCTHAKKHTLWFALAQQIVSQINNREPILIATGTPVREGQTKSNHAIYASLRKNGKNEITVAITNGGDGVSTFHNVADTWNEKDIGSKRYYYAGFVIPNDSTHLPVLIHYVFKLISLRHTLSIQDLPKNAKTKQGRETHPKHFMSQLSNIYLRTKDPHEESFFLGKGGAKFTLFKRQDFKETFREQLGGTCSMFNFVRAIKFLFAMNELQFGLLQHNLSIGFDMLITELKETQNLPPFKLKP